MAALGTQKKASLVTSCCFMRPRGGHVAPPLHAGLAGLGVPGGAVLGGAVLGGQRLDFAISASTLRAPEPTEAMYKKMKQYRTAGSPPLSMGQNAFG